MYKYLKMMLFHSKTETIKYFLDPAPPKKMQGYKRLTAWLHVHVLVYTGSL